MKTLKEYVLDAHEKKVAIGHFNVSNSDGLLGVFRAARSLNVPVIVGSSEGERDFIGVKQISALVKSFREEYNFPIFLNADHTYSFERVKEAIDSGFDSVIYDGTSLSFEENILNTKKSVDYAKSVSPDILVEGELGFIGLSSKILDEIPADVKLDSSSLTHPSVAKEFVEKTGVQLFSPAVGNLHGMLRSGIDPKLNISLIKEISETVGIPLVLHGGSGNSEEDLKNAILNGVSIVHINTEIRLAYKQGVVNFLQENPDEIAPYKFLSGGVKNVEEIVIKKLKIFNNL